MAATDIVGINVWRRQAVTEDDSLCRVTNLYDEDGDEISELDDPSAAVAAVVELPGGLWASVVLEHFNRSVN